MILILNKIYLEKNIYNSSLKSWKKQEAETTMSANSNSLPLLQTNCEIMLMLLLYIYVYIPYVVKKM